MSIGFFTPGKASFEELEEMLTSPEALAEDSLSVSVLSIDF